MADADANGDEYIDFNEFVDDMSQKLNIKLKKICGGQLSQGGYCPAPD